jgi:hypothetical protein
MAEKPGRDKAKAPAARRARGFLRAGGLIDGQMKTLAARRGFALARLEALWPEIAGAEAAAICHPARLSTSRGPAGGLLTLGVAPAHGPQVQMLLPVLRERINAALGPGAVGRIQLVQATRAIAPTPPRPAPRPAPAADLGGLAGPVSTIGDDALRQALETLARNVLSRSRT